MQTFLPFSYNILHTFPPVFYFRSMNNRYYLGIILLLLVFGCKSYSTMKRELERSIQYDSLPQTIRLITDELILATDQVSCYDEFDGDIHTYELKIIREGRNFSLEFFPDGSVMDIEFTVPFQEATRQEKEFIDSVLKQHVGTYQVVRFQRQYIYYGEKETLSNWISRMLNASDILPPDNFEVEVEISNPKKFGFWEFTISPTGRIVLERQIDKRFSDNVW